VTAVTKVMKIKNFKNISILDSPGFNDPDKTRSDAQTFIDMTNTLYDKDILWGGVATLLQCVMVPQSGRINATAIELMSKML
jgi:DNA-directed RNA polymerase beta' subunit